MISIYKRDIHTTKLKMNYTTTYYYYSHAETGEPMVWTNKDEAVSWMDKHHEPLESLFETDLDWEGWAETQREYYEYYVDTPPTPNHIMRDQEGEFDHFWLDGTPVFKLMDVEEYAKMEADMVILEKYRKSLHEIADYTNEDDMESMCGEDIVPYLKKKDAEIERLKREAYDEAHGVQLETGLTLAELVEDWRKGKAWSLSDQMRADTSAESMEEFEQDVRDNWQEHRDMTQEIEQQDAQISAHEESLEANDEEIERLTKKHNDLLETMAPAGPELTLEEADEEVDKVGDHMRAVLSASPRSPDVVHWGCRC
jgi:hypothetical protein